MRFAVSLTLLALCVSAPAAYRKIEAMIPMRDGIKLYTAIYVPTDRPGKHPILMERTPYGSDPYGADNVPRWFGGSRKLIEDGFIFVSQDVRGKYMSQGTYEDVRPQSTNPKGTDESTDAWDTIDWLVKNVPENNGRVGLWGVSYPGFYAAAAAIHSHPALKAVSAQAPVSDWWRGDDDHHNGALFLQDCFGFNAGGFGMPRPEPMPREPQGIPLNFSNAYDWYLKQGPLSNYDRLYFEGQCKYWLDVMAHPNYDEFWRSRNLGDKMKGVTCAMLTVGGLYDAEDMYGAWNIWFHTGKFNPGIENRWVMGPWSHGQWSDGSAKRLGQVDFGSDTATFFREQIEYPFFREHLLGIKPDQAAPKITMFETGANQWHKFASWPPASVKKQSFYFAADHEISMKSPTASKGSDAYVSDPAHPIPYTIPTPRWRNRTYMIQDERMFAGRKDIVAYRTEPLKESLELAGKLDADLWLKTTATDLDVIVKVMDEFPDGQQQVVRWEVLRGRFRDHPDHPEAIPAGKPTRFAFTLNDVCHQFKAGHRIRVSVQSSAFPLISVNPQTFVDHAKATASDFKSATVEILRTKEHPSRVILPIWTPK